MSDRIQAPVVDLEKRNAPGMSPIGSAGGPSNFGDFGFKFGSGFPKYSFTVPPSIIAGTTWPVMKTNWASSITGSSIVQDLIRNTTKSLSNIFVPGLTTGALGSILANLPSWEDMARGIYPVNILDAEAHITIAEMKAWMLEEGLPIAWVPRAATIDALHKAGSASARRVVFGRRWKTTLTDCETILRKVSTAEVAPFATHAQKAIDGIREGHHELAQAFIANTLDTTTRRWMPTSLRTDVTSASPKKRKDPDTFSSRQFFAFAQLQGIYRPYFPDDGDPIPASFNRHAAAHGVSRRQYSRINAVIGAAHLTSWLWFVDTSFSPGT